MPRRSVPVAGRRCARISRARAPWRGLARNDWRRRGDAGAGLLPRPVRRRSVRAARRQPDGPARQYPHRCGTGPRPMTTRVYIPRDAAALALGADSVAAFLRQAADVEIVRTGSRGLLWLEPVVEVATPEGRIAYGPVSLADVPGLIEAGMLTGGAHRLRLGRPEEIPWLARQTRLTFARCGITDPVSLDDYRAHGGLKGLARAIEIGADATIEIVTKSGLRGRGGAGFPT